VCWEGWLYLTNTAECYLSKRDNCNYTHIFPFGISGSSL
jgi:hypothetical protein